MAQESRGIWTLKWVKDRMAGGHHAALTQYLVQRSPFQADQANEVGFTVERILVQAFNVKNGHVTVPLDACKVLRNVEGATPQAVWDIVRESEATSPEALSKRLNTFKRAVLAWAKRTGGDPSPWINLVLVQEVMSR
jgi:hypothetical protein